MVETKVLRSKEGVFTLPRMLSMYAEDAEAGKGAAVFAALAADSGIQAAVQPDGAVLRFVRDGLLKEEAYRLLVTPEGITAFYNTWGRRAKRRRNAV